MADQRRTEGRAGEVTAWDWLAFLIWNGIFAVVAVLGELRILVLQGRGL